MTPALTPELGLDYLRELSADVRTGVVLDSAGVRLAGPAALEAPARALLAAAPDAEAIEVAAPGGTVFAARSASHAIALVCGPQALGALALHDLGLVLGDLAGARSGPA